MKTIACQCRICDYALFVPEEEACTPLICPRCGATIHARQPQAVARAFALSLAATIMLIPANFLPVMDIQILGRSEPNTILSGVLTLWKSGLWPLAVVVFTASFVVPFFKLVSLWILLLATQGRWPAHKPGFAKLYRVIRFIGRWSMLDVFLVAFLAGLVQLHPIVSVPAEPGIFAFGSAVVLTILATTAFDSRLMWDREKLSVSPST